jgi:hypothetical protein
LTVIDTIIKTISATGELTLELLGGEAIVQAAQEELAQSPFLDFIAELAAKQHGSTALDAAVLRGLEVGTDAASFRDAISILVESEALNDRIGVRARDVLVSRVAQRQAEGLPLIAVYALEGLVRFSLEAKAAPFQLLTLLDGVKSDDAGPFAFHAARLIGLANDHWPFEHLQGALVRLLENQEAEPQAAFELGLLYLKRGLESKGFTECLEHLEGASIYFQRAIEAGDCRDDAVAYAALMTVIVGFAKESPQVALIESVEILERAVFARSAFIDPTEVPEWTRPRLGRELEWASLARMTRSAAQDLTRPSWSKAYQVLGQVLAVYDADRTLRTGAGLARLVRPRIERAFVCERGLLAHLDDFLDDDARPSEFNEAAAVLRAAVHSILKDGPPSSDTDGSALFPNVPAVLVNSPAFKTLPQGFAGKLESYFRDKAYVMEASGNPVYQEVMEKVLPALHANSEYASEIRRCFDQLLQQIILFCGDRLDMSRKGWGVEDDRIHYLFNKDAHERDLQDDLRQFLHGNLGWISNIFFEVDSIGAGRIDIAVLFGMLRFIIELKRESSDASRENLRRYLGQSTAYQASSIRLGFLGVLDLTPRVGPAPTLAENVWVETYCPDGQNLHRTVVVFRVPGNLESPSTFSKKKSTKSP